jgi:hypothetical protein
MADIGDIERMMLGWNAQKATQCGWEQIRKWGKRVNMKKVVMRRKSYIIVRDKNILWELVKCQTSNCCKLKHSVYKLNSGLK